MKFDSIITSNHALKKNGYKMLRKLHKLEDKKGAREAYKAAYENTYFFVLACQDLARIIELEYGNDDIKWIRNFKMKSDSFIAYLNAAASVQKKIDKGILAGYLRAYTKFFNRVIEEHIVFHMTPEILALWNEKCLMAYIATWGIH